MILNFKLFENKEDILNDILDKIQQYGKDSLSSDELNFLKNYPNADLETKPEQRQTAERIGEIFKSEHFEFEFLSSDLDELSNSFIISGIMYFNKQKIEGYFLVNEMTYQIFPYFTDVEGYTAYDYASGYEDEFYDFLEEIYEKIKNR